MQSNADEQLSPHFTRSELACQHCGALVLDERLVPALEQLRQLAGAPVVIVSGYRCPVDNAGALGVPKSAHLDGRAADIRILGPAGGECLSLQQVYDLAVQVPDFRDGGIGIYDAGTVHVDVRSTSARWARVKGVYMGIAASKLLERYP